MFRAPSPIWNEGSCSLFGCNDVYGTGIHTNLLSFPFFSNYMSFFFSWRIITCSSFLQLLFYFIFTISRWYHHGVHRGKIETQDPESTETTITTASDSQFSCPSIILCCPPRSGAQGMTRSEMYLCSENTVLGRAMVELSGDSLCNV